MRSTADDDWVPLLKGEFFEVVIKLKESYLEPSLTPSLEEDKLLISFILIVLALRNQCGAGYGVDF